MNEIFRNLFRGSKEPSPIIQGQFTPEIGTRSLRAREWELPSEVEVGLSRNEREMLSLGVKAGRSIARLYNVQEGRGIRANFYPPHIRREVVRKAAKNNPEILSHYTVVTKKPDGSLTWFPMHQAYSNIIRSERLPETLREAAEAARRAGDITSFQYLSAKADSFLSGNYKTSDRIWLTRPDQPKVNIVIGYYDNYTDKFQGIKYAAEAWIGVKDEEGTQDARWFQEEFLRAWESKTGLTAPKNEFLLLHTKGMYGQAAKYDWTGNSLPCQIDWRQELGTLNTIFVPVFEEKFTQRRLPVYRSAIVPSKRVAVSDNFVRRVNMRTYIGHEISHSLIPDGLDSRLQQYALPMKELFCDLSALNVYGDIPPDGKKIINREKVVALGVLFANGVLEHIDYSRDQSRPEYYVSSSTILKFMQEAGSVQISNGHIDWNNEAAIRDLDTIHKIVREILEKGKVRDARAFFGRYFDGEIYEPMARSVERVIPFNIPSNHTVPKDEIDPLINTSPLTGKIA